MATNLALDDSLIQEAKEIGHHKTKKEAVTAALTQYIQRHRQIRIVELFGKIDYHKEYDYKKMRYRKSS